MKTHIDNNLHRYLLLALVGVLLYAAMGCSAVRAITGAPDPVEVTWVDVSEDDHVSPDEMRSMDRVLDIEKERDDWLGALLGYGMQLFGLGLPTGVATAVAVNKSRDRRRRLRGEPVVPPAKASA